MKKIEKLINDVIPVILGILIALVINNWNEDRKEQKYLDQIFASINEELKESIQSLEDNIPKQERLRDSLMVDLNNESVTLFDVISKAGGIWAPRIKNNSWRAVANSRIELVEFDKLSELSELDDSKITQDYKQKKIMDFVIENVKSTSSDKKEILMMMVSEMISSGKYLQSEIEEIIE